VSPTRRTFIKTGATAAAAIATPRPLLAHLGARPEPVPPIQDPRVKALALRAVDVARTAGAAYADVRLTYTWERNFGGGSFPGDGEFLGVGVRALVNGYWGFASGPVWSPGELARLGREAVVQAKANARGKPRAVELGQVPVIADEHWVMPVEIDPFDVPVAEVIDFFNGLKLYATRVEPSAATMTRCLFWRQDKAFASTEGSYCTQRLYRTQSGLGLTYDAGKERLSTAVDFLPGAGAGWEYIREAPLRESVPRLMEELRADFALPRKPVQVGRYDTVFDAATMATLLDETLGTATELDRALGYEANAGGTSFLNDPLGMLGQYQLGASLLNVSANRSEPRGLATVKWDDDGVVPRDFRLVRNGVLADFQTTRESAAWLSAYYEGQQEMVRSHGCANAPTAIEAPLVSPPNLVLGSGRESADFEALIAGIRQGLAIKGAEIDLDFQQLNGVGIRGRMYEVKNGKPVARVAGGGFLFRAPELWKSLAALGGEASRRRVAMFRSKGEPRQTTWHTVSAVPGVVKQLTVVDLMRRA
jgi:TldD protein